MWRRYRFLFIVTAIITLLLAFVVEGDGAIIRFTNAAFLVALAYILIGGFLFVSGKGFFQRTKNGFKLLKGEKEDISGENIFPITMPLLMTGIGLAMFTFLVSLV